MALITSEGRYVKVLYPSSDFQRVQYLIFRNADQRSRYPDALEPFETFKQDSLYTPGLLGLLGETANGGETIFNNVIAACYAALKNDSQFSEAQDA